VHCKHKRYKNGGYLTADNALKAMKAGRVAWIGITIKNCEDCGEDLSKHRVVPVKTAQEILGDIVC